MTKNLLDTHAFIWYINGDKELSASARARIEAKDAVNYVSIASLWEIAIKVSLGKLELNGPYLDVIRQIDNNGFEILSVEVQDTLTVSTLPFHHRDPFDRIIIAQSITNSLTLLSRDPEFRQYDVKVIW